MVPVRTGGAGWLGRSLKQTRFSEKKIDNLRWPRRSLALEKLRANRGIRLREKGATRAVILAATALTLAAALAAIARKPAPVRQDGIPHAELGAPAPLTVSVVSPIGDVAVDVGNSTLRQTEGFQMERFSGRPQSGAMTARSLWTS